MDYDKQFKLKFNELDQLCKLMYPKYLFKFDAMRQFAYSLDGKNKSTLLNLIKARNVGTHDPVDLISFNPAAIDFLQGLIDGANRKYYNGLRGKIDPDIENLRTKNLKIMSSTLNNVINKYSHLDYNSIKRVKDYLNKYIDLERKANKLELVKKYYFDFLNEVKLIGSRNGVVIIESVKKEKTINENNNRSKKTSVNDEKSKNNKKDKVKTNDNYPKKYIRAMNFFEKGLYIEALSIYHKYQNQKDTFFYDDCIKKIDYCKKKIYSNGKNLIKNGNYIDARMMFAVLVKKGGYKDAKEQFDDCVKRIYKLALTYVKKGDYSEARRHLNAIGNYKDSKAILEKIKNK